MADPAEPRPGRRHCACEGDRAPARARREVRRLVGDAVLNGDPVPADVEEAALLVAGELVTNAVKYATGRCGLPGGYGWPLVQCLASRVDVLPTREARQDRPRPHSPLRPARVLTAAGGVGAGRGAG